MALREQLYFNADIYTVDEAMPTAEAVAVRDGIIVAVGSEETCRDALGAGAETSDLGGAALLPGFIDTHLHPTLMAFFEVNVDLGKCASIGEVQDRLREQLAEDGEWILGLNFDEQTLDTPRWPDRHDLDAVSAERPVVVLKHDGHSLIANTTALERCSISAATPDPPGGTIDREADGNPAGPLRETAAQLVMDRMPSPDLTDLQAAAGRSFERLAAQGITSIGAILQTDAEGPAGAGGAFDLVFMSMIMDSIPQSCTAWLIANELEPIETARQSPLNQGRHRVAGLKLFADGTFGSCTAWMDEPFSDHPERRGGLVQTEEELYRRMEFAHAAGLQIAIHAIGDAGNRTCVELYRRLLQEHPRDDHRHRIEHASALNPAIIEDMARLGIVVSSQPMFIHSEKHYLHARLGRERARWVYPYRTLLDAGVIVAGASDAPVESFSVLHAMECCVTREGFETRQCVTVAEAVRMYTLDAAHAQHEEGRKGSISPGKRADFVVLDQNPTTAPPNTLKDIQVLQTIVGGKTIHSA